MKFIIKKFFIISLFIVSLTITNNSFSESIDLKDNGILSIMYHRFEENKYPSTNIRVKDFKSHINFIKNSGFKFISFEEFEKSINFNNYEKKMLLTVDDAFSSFYNNAWPFLKKEKIPFILFTNTETVGSSGYMNWEQIKEISSFDFVHIGNHSHSHEYLVDKSDDEIKKDIELSIKIFEKNLKYKTKFFAYPFGEYKNSYKKIVENLGFEYAFGQHSGVMDKTKDKFELPRFPINEKYGEEKRFKSILNTLPFPYKVIYPEEKYLTEDNNPPEIKIVFFKDGPKFKNISCYSNEGNKWRKSNIEFLGDYELKVIIDEKFTTERGRINCSLRENSGKWRWLGIQFVIANL